MLKNHHLDALIADIKRHEGYREKVFEDSLGNLTCGWGHYLRLGSKVPADVCNAFLAQDIALAVNGFNRIDKKTQDKLDPVQKRVIVEMIFILGYNGCLNFKKMWKAIRKQDFEEAATQLLDSRMAQQIGRRALRWQTY